MLAHQEACPGGSPRDVLAWFIELWRGVVVSASGASGCAVAGVTVELGGEADLVELARSIFRRWIEVLAAYAAGQTAAGAA